MINLIFATNNKHKVEEVATLLPLNIAVKSLKEAGINIDIPEPYNTLEENALTKATTILNLTNQDCFSEDTGLEVEALNGQPGVKTARYAENEPIYKNNYEKLLFNLEGIENRNAQFRTIIVLIFEGKTYYFEGICKGCIAITAKGLGGFGYDPVFIPTGSNKTFAQMSLAEKTEFSHRAKAFEKVKEFFSLKTK